MYKIHGIKEKQQMNVHVHANSECSDGGRVGLFILKDFHEKKKKN